MIRPPAITGPLVPGFPTDLVMPNGDLLWVHARIPQGDEQLPLPDGWKIKCRNLDGNAYYHDALGLAVIISGARQSDGKRWLHVSVSHRQKRYPSWREMEKVKADFLGPDAYAVSILPPERYFVHIAPVLHLFSCVDGHPLPEFSGVLPDGRRTL